MGIIPIEALHPWFWETLVKNQFVTIVTNLVTFVKIVINIKTILQVVECKIVVVLVVLVVVVLEDKVVDLVVETRLKPFQEVTM
jgi:hypothetical protein